MNAAQLTVSASPISSAGRRYPRALRVLHWALALLFAVQIALMLVLRQLESLEMGQIVLDLHRQAGMLVLLLVAARLAFALRLKPPPLAIPRWQRLAARTVHLALYAALAVQPLLGMLTSWARGDDVLLLGLVRIPPPLQLTTEQGVALEAWHRWLAYGLLLLLAVHLGAVAFHRFVRRAPIGGAMLPSASPGRLVNRVPVSAQLCCCFALILTVTLGAGAYAAHQYAGFKQLRSEFDETEVALLDEMRTTRLAVAPSWGESASEAPDLAATSREAAATIRGFVARLGDPGARASVRLAAVTFDRIAKGERSPKLAAAGAQALQDAIDSQYMVVFQGRLTIAQTAATGHDAIVLAFAPTILLCGLLAFLLSRSIMLALARARDLVRSVEHDTDAGTEVVGSGEFAALTRDILRMRDAVKARQQASDAREVEIARDASGREIALARAASAREAETARRAALEQEQVTSAIAQGLAALVSGNLRYRILTPCPGGYDQIRVDFNEAIGRIEAAMEVISDASSAIGAGSNGVAQAAAELAARTEEQTASLSATAAALDRMTDKMRSSARDTVRVADAAAATRALAAQSDGCVGEAIAAMTDIERSAERIAQIVATIEAIAARSNLLALNAAVEAARAGDSGKGFGVVAHEVRALAQQAKSAAGHIGSLVDDSNRQIDIGVASVRRTGTMFEEIVREIHGVDALVAGITASAQDQAAELNEVNVALLDMNGIVREDAAMVLQTTAELQRIRDKAAALDALIKRVAMNDEGTATVTGAAQESA